MIISLILITFSLDNILRSLGENWCWSFSGLNPNNDDSRQVAKKTAFFTNYSWTPKTSSFHSRGVLLQWRVMWGCSMLTYNHFTALFKLKFKSQLVITFFAAINYLSGPLRKQNFTSTGSKGHVWDLPLVDFDPFWVFLCFKVRCLWS